MQTLFWICLFIIFYTFIGYGLLLYLLVKIKNLFGKKEQVSIPVFLPMVTLLVTAFNEEKVIGEKIRNTLSLQYPPGKIRYLFVTDGSQDATPHIVSQYPLITLMHLPERQGKMAALNRAMQMIETEIVVVTDANTSLNPDSLLLLCKHFQNPLTGAVAGEKRVLMQDLDNATSLEGVYWKFESSIKQLEAEFYSVMGAAGELFGFRAGLYKPLPEDTLLDDFMISMVITAKGYRIRYEPRAIAIETTSMDIKEELKRKKRIASGALQSLFRMHEWIPPISQPQFWFEFISHRFFRWIITPYLLPILLLLNIQLMMATKVPLIIVLIFSLQVVFYMLACFGFLLQNKMLKKKWFFIPFYFCMMNYALVAGMFRFLAGKHSVIWEKSARR